MTFYQYVTEVPNKLKNRPITYILSEKTEVVFNKMGASKWYNKASLKIMDALLNK